MNSLQILIAPIRLNLGAGCGPLQRIGVADRAGVVSSTRLSDNGWMTSDRPRTSNHQHRQRTRWRVVALALVWAIAVPLSTEAADRTTCFVPMSGSTDQNLPAGAMFPDQACGDQAVRGWNAYQQLWRAHHDQPANRAVRRYLGLPLEGQPAFKQRRGRSAPRWLAWRDGSYSQFDTPHFVVYSRADRTINDRILHDLERCYWVWTQMFFPLWESSDQVATTLGEFTENQSIIDHLQQQSSRLATRSKLRVVVFRDAQEYQQTIRVPGVERSTGFYSDERKTTFLYAASTDDPATRRHELVHQLFREATRSGLRRQMPGEASEFWLIEGIAGYFESLHFADGYATLGGWDSPRLQFARYRFFINGDRMPMQPLRADGRLAAQQRSDIARWYAHAIAQTHRLLDGGNGSHRNWIYRQLAKLYQVKTKIAVDPTTRADDDLGDAQDMLNFLSIDDDHIRANRVVRPLTHLCLAGCSITPAGLQAIPPAPDLSRLTLAGRSIDVAAVARLVTQPESIEQLSLEGTGINSSIKRTLSQSDDLRELDLSGTAVDDEIILAIRDAKQLSTLWMTGTAISDRSIPAMIGMTGLQNIDLQRTRVSDSGIAKLKQARPDLNVNPLQIQESNP